jgi:hypothetical protein
MSARVDADGLDWLKSQEKSYQSRINGIPRQEMLTSAKIGFGKLLPGCYTSNLSNTMSCQL